MGSVTDPMAVLDPELRVKGVSRLRVVDASAMPKLPAVNPNITVMTMAEKCADLIRTDADLRSGSASPSWASTRRSSRCRTANSPIWRQARRWSTSPRARWSPTTPTRVPDDVWMVRSGTGDAAGERRRHHHRHRRARRHLRLHPAAHRRRNGVRRAGDGAEHPDPAARCAGAGAVRQAGGSGVPGIVGVECRPCRSADDRADDRQQTGRRPGARRRAPGRPRRIGARRRRAG